MSVDTENHRSVRNSVSENSGVLENSNQGASEVGANSGAGGQRSRTQSESDTPDTGQAGRRGASQVGKQTPNNLNIEGKKYIILFHIRHF